MITFPKKWQCKKCGYQTATSDEDEDKKSPPVCPRCHEIMDEQGLVKHNGPFPENHLKKY